MESITIKDIARICGVGVSTVSRAMNNHPDINKETRDKVMRVMKEHNFIPNNSARNLKRSDSNTVAVLIKGISNPFFSKMIQILEEEIHYRKHSFILHRVDEREDEIDVALELIKEKKLKGIIFLGGHFYHNQEKLAKLAVPFVLSTVGVVGLTGQRFDVGAGAVGPDGGAMAAVPGFDVGAGAVGLTGSGFGMGAGEVGLTGPGFGVGAGEAGMTGPGFGMGTGEVGMTGPGFDTVGPDGGAMPAVGVQVRSPGEGTGTLADGFRGSPAGDGPGPAFSSVSVDDYTESYRMTRYLLELGHRDILILAARPDDESIGKLRLMGYLKAMAEYGAGDGAVGNHTGGRVSKGLVSGGLASEGHVSGGHVSGGRVAEGFVSESLVPGDPASEDLVSGGLVPEGLVEYMPEGIESYTPQCGYASMKKALDAGKRFTAVFAVSDSMAIGACKALYDAGKRIPEDVSVAGFDGIDMAYYYHPSITTIRQPVEEMSKETAKLLFDLIDGQAPKKQLVFAGELRSGESTQALG